MVYQVAEKVARELSCWPNLGTQREDVAPTALFIRAGNSRRRQYPKLRPAIP
jgi:hypothetical protein